MRRAWNRWSGTGVLAWSVLAAVSFAASRADAQTAGVAPSAEQRAIPRPDTDDDADDDPAPSPAAATSVAPSAASAPDVEHAPRVRRSHRPPPAPGYGRLRIAVNRAETEVFIDGRDVGIAPYENDLLHGPHEIRLESPGFKSWHGSVDVDEGALTPLRVMLRPQADRSSGAMTLGIATFVLGVGVSTGVASNIDHASLESDRLAGQLDNHDPRIDRGAILAGTADACFLLAAVVGALGIYLVAHDTGSPSIGRAGQPHRFGASARPAE